MYTVDKEGNPHSVQKVENYVEIEEVGDNAPSEPSERIDMEQQIKKLLRMKMQPMKESFLQRYGLYLLLLLVILVGAGCWFYFSKKNQESKVEEPKFGLYF